MKGNDLELWVSPRCDLTLQGALALSGDILDVTMIILLIGGQGCCYIFSHVQNTSPNKELPHQNVNTAKV